MTHLRVMPLEGLGAQRAPGSESPRRTAASKTAETRLEALWGLIRESG
jgi:hypothetical protein